MKLIGPALVVALVMASGAAYGEQPVVRVALWDPGSPPTMVSIRGSFQISSGGHWKHLSEAVVKSREGRLEYSGGRGARAEITSGSYITLTAAGRKSVTVRGRLRLIARRGGVLAVYEDPVEDYTARVIQAECPAEWPVEAQRAQAVVSRSFGTAASRRHGSDGFDMCPLTHCQRWSGAVPAAASVRAAEATRGVVLQLGSNVAAAAFHSTCGGRTADGKTVGMGVFLVPVTDDGACSRSPHYRWSTVLTDGELRTVFGSKGGAFEVRSRDLGGRAAVVSFGGRAMDGGAFVINCGRKLGWARVKSNSFVARRTGGGWLLNGSGLGHGCGMCQWGAAGLARKGRTWRQIVALYYPKLKVGRR